MLAISMMAGYNHIAHAWQYQTQNRHPNSAKTKNCRVGISPSVARGKLRFYSVYEDERNRLIDVQNMDEGPFSRVLSPTPRSDGPIFTEYMQCSESLPTKQHDTYTITAHVSQAICGVTPYGCTATQQ
jgi:hypothetical protein